MEHLETLSPYRRPDGYIPRVALVHDLCGYGQCSLGVAIPVLDGYLDAWQKEGVELDAVYSGFLGAPEQVASILRLYREHPSALRIVDPVMGDGGKRYPTYTEELCDEMRELVSGADLLTPNLTEGSILTGVPYEGQDVDDGYVQAMLDALLDLGAKTVVLKGIARGDGLIRNFIAAPGYEVSEVACELLPFMLHGTGDLYCSALLGAVMCGKSLLYKMRGVSFETVLKEVVALVP